MRRALGRAFRETGQAMDRAGLTVSGNELFKETYARHRPIMNLGLEKVGLISTITYKCMNSCSLRIKVLWGGGHGIKRFFWAIVVRVADDFEFVYLRIIL